MQFFDSDGVRIAYIDVAPASGAGDPVLLIHGFGSNHAVNWVNAMWVKTLTHAGYRAIALDNRGHGQSDKPHTPASKPAMAMADGTWTIDGRFAALFPPANLRSAMRHRPCAVSHEDCHLERQRDSSAGRADP